MFYYTQCKVNGMTIDRYDTYDEALDAIDRYEAEDEEEGNYSEDCYEVATFTHERIDEEDAARVTVLEFCANVGRNIHGNVIPVDLSDYTSEGEFLDDMKNSNIITDSLKLYNASGSLSGCPDGADALEVWQILDESGILYDTEAAARFVADVATVGFEAALASSK